MKKISLILLTLLMSFGFFYSVSAAAQNPWVICTGLPGCPQTTEFTPDIKWAAQDDARNAKAFQFLWNVIAEGIKYAAVAAVISLMISWVMFVVSAWDEDKITKSRKWITWSLVWVLLTVSAWSLVNLVNSFKIN